MRTQPYFDLAVAIIRPTAVVIALLASAKLLFPVLAGRSFDEIGIAIAVTAFVADSYSQRAKDNAERYNHVKVDIGKLQDAIERHEACLIHPGFEEIWGAVQRLSSSNNAQIGALKELIVFSDRLSKLESKIEEISCEANSNQHDNS